MRITMLVTIEHAHSYIVRDQDDVPSIEWDVQKFYAGRSYNHSKAYDEWTRRARYFIKMGWAAKVGR